MQKRETLSPDAVDDMSLAIANKLLELHIWDFSYYHIFLPIVNKKEVNTDFIFNILAGKDKNIVLPKSDFTTNTLQHILLTDNTLIKPNKYGIPEPVEGLEVPESKIDVIFVPLLAYDTLGNRIGYGKGFYDRFLRECKNEVIKIGLSFFEPESAIFEVDDYDEPLNHCVTPDHIYTFEER